MFKVVKKNTNTTFSLVSDETGENSLKTVKHFNQSNVSTSPRNQSEVKSFFYPGGRNRKSLKLVRRPIRGAYSLHPLGISRTIDRRRKWSKMIGVPSLARWTRQSECSYLNRLISRRFHYRRPMRSRRQVPWTNEKS